MESLGERRKKLDELVVQAEKLHDRGELNAALKLYRQALNQVFDRQERARIQQRIDELHDMVTFVETVDSEKCTDSAEMIKDWIQENTVALYSLLIVIAAILALVMIVPPLLGLFDAGPPAPAPLPSVSEDPDKIAEADGDNAAPMELRGKRDDTGMVIEESDSKVTLTIPARFLEPYPIRYVRQDQAPIQAGPADSTEPLDRLARNTRVQLIGANPTKTWLQIRRFEDAQGKALANTQDVWIQAALLADDRIRTPEEIDAEIKARFGGNYWAIDAKDNASVLLINAPTAQLAQESLVTGFSHYASRQLLKLINAHGHQPFDRLEAEAAPLQLNGNPASFQLDFKIYGHNADRARQLVGEKSLTVKRGSDGRYRLREALEGL